jgi:hypothetical protein
MKTFLVLLILVMAAFTTAKAQAPDPTDPHWCVGCSPIEKQRTAERVNSASRLPGKSNTSTNGDPGLMPRSRTDRNSPPYVLKVRFLVRNESDKKIKRVTWEYTISNRETKAFIQTVTFVTDKTIAPRKSAVLKQKVYVSREKLLGGTVPAGQAGQKPPPNVEVEENYRIKEIKYADGSVHTP